MGGWVGGWVVGGGWMGYLFERGEDGGLFLDVHVVDGEDQVVGWGEDVGEPEFDL